MEWGVHGRIHCSMAHETATIEVCRGVGECMRIKNIMTKAVRPQCGTVIPTIPLQPWRDLSRGQKDHDNGRTAQNGSAFPCIHESGAEAKVHKKQEDGVQIGHRLEHEATRSIIWIKRRTKKQTTWPNAFVTGERCYAPRMRMPKSHPQVAKRKHTKRRAYSWHSGANATVNKMVAHSPATNASDHSSARATWSDMCAAYMRRFVMQYAPYVPRRLAKTTTWDVTSTVCTRMIYKPIPTLYSITLRNSCNSCLSL